MDDTRSISGCFAQARATRNPLYLLKGVYRVASQRRLLEAAYGVYCGMLMSRPEIDSPKAHREVVQLDDDVGRVVFGTRDLLFRPDLLTVYGGDYAVDLLPEDFLGARVETAVMTDDSLILGEYGRPGKRIAVVTRRSCTINHPYESDRGVRHIHAVCKLSDAGAVLISTGDTAKYLDLFELQGTSLRLVRRIRSRLAGHTAMLPVGDTCLLGTDFTGRLNYVETYGPQGTRKFAFPRQAHGMFTLKFFRCANGQVACLSREMECIGGRHALSIFDVAGMRFVGCELVDYVEPITIDAELHREAVRIRSAPSFTAGR